MDDKNGVYRISRASGCVMAAVLLLTVVGLPLGTLGRMALKRIPISEYGENILGRYKMIGFNTALTEWLSGGLYMESNEVLLGKEGWLFYKTDTDGEPLYDYMGVNRFSDEELDDIYDGLEQLGDRLSEAGIRYAVMTVPNKEQVYSEYMPDTVERISDISRLDQLTSYMEERQAGAAGAENAGSGAIYIEGQYPYVDMTETFINAPDKEHLYYRYDTHWTDIGSFTALSEVNKALYGRGLSKPVFGELPGFEGDLARISATLDRYSDTSYPIEEGSIPAGDIHEDETLLIIGDSFGDAMMHVARYYYGDVKFVSIPDLKEGMIEECSPDVVILECVERYLPRLIGF